MADVLKPPFEDVTVGQIRQEEGCGIYDIEQVDARVGLVLARSRFSGEPAWIPTQRVLRMKMLLGCPVCNEPVFDTGDHFDGTYFTCDPEAECNQPGYDREKDGNRG